MPPGNGKYRREMAASGAMLIDRNPFSTLFKAPPMRSLPLFATGLLLLGGPATGQVPAEPDIQGHRALYELTLSRAVAGSDIADVSGVLAFEISDACDGWISDQRFSLDYAYQNAEPTSYLSDLSSWESKDGRALRFNVRRMIDGDVTERISGSAERDGSGGRAEFDEPGNGNVGYDLAAPVRFPTDHLIAILRGAAAGDRFISIPLFDGSEVAGAVPVSAFIIGEVPPAAVLEQVGAEDIDADLLQSPAFRIRVAFFDADEQIATPVYEMTVVVHMNGLVSEMLLDYEDMSLEGTLTALAPLEPPDC